MAGLEERSRVPRPTTDESLGRRVSKSRPKLSLSPSPPSTMLRSSLSKTLVNATSRASRLAPRPVLARGYHEKVISHYEKPRNVCLAPSGLALTVIR